MLRNMMMAASGLAALMAAAPAVAATAITPTGTGTVEFRFLSFSGPVATLFDGGEIQTGQLEVNGAPVPLMRTGAFRPIRPGATASSGVGWLDGGADLTAQLNADIVRFGTIGGGENSNIIQFAPRNFTNVAQGQDFILGTIFFRNGGWLGGAPDPTFDVRTILPFEIKTTPNNADPKFTQTQRGVITLRSTLDQGGGPNRPTRATATHGHDHSVLGRWAV